MKEANIMRIIQLALGKMPNVKLFRNNVGQAWAGNAKRLNGSGNVLIENARPLHAGLCEGSSDLIGWTEVTITPDMLGKKFARFTALEIKANESSRVTDKQRNFLEVVVKAGGIAGIAHSPDGARSIIEYHGK